MYVEKGEAKTFAYTAYSDSGSVMDLTGYSITLTVSRDLNVDSPIITRNASIVSASAGTFTLSITANETVSLEKNYYPYKIVLSKDGITTLFEVGMFNVLTHLSRWEWYLDIFTGVTLSSIRNAVKKMLRYDDWEDEDLDMWINNSIEKYCENTALTSSYAITSTVYNKYVYNLPVLILDVEEVYYESVLNSDEWRMMTKGTEWDMIDEQLVFYSSASVESDTNGHIKGGYRIKLVGKKYAQPLVVDADYLECPKGSDRAIVDYAVYLVKKEDRADAGERDTFKLDYAENAKEKKNRHSVRNSKPFCLGYRNADVIGGRYSGTDPLNRL